MFTVDGEKVKPLFTVTDWFAEVYPGADAEMLTVPKFTPVICG